MSRSRRLLTTSLFALSGVLLLLANLLAWVECTLLDSSEFQERTAAALDEPESRERTASVIATAIVNSGSVDQAIDERLSDELRLLAPVLKSQLENGLAATAERVLAADAIQGLRDDAVLRFHGLVLGVLKDERVVGARQDQIVLDLSDYVPAVVQELGLRAAERAGGGDSALEDGTIVLVDDAGAVRSASFIARNTDVVAIVLALVAIGLLVLAVSRLADLRTGIRRSGYVVLAAGLASMLLVFIVNQAIDGAYPDRVVLQELVGSLLSNLRLQSLLLVVVGVVAAAATDRRLLGAAERGWAGTQDYFQRTGIPAPLVVAVAVVVLLLIF
jgi:hypothetical protein